MYIFFRNLKSNITCHIKKVGFFFLVRDNTKNFADKRFNNMKNEYRKENLYTMKDLIASCNKSDYVVVEHVD